ncbi:DgyrCDS12361 [Dimorphilus gyrociliatus]|uniref:DgyrCDS12361 n=1 Tax=Dimorphilus gyrociliatus TaxID=2664684 RepID=A0A7I8W687_9ANNE|nr:DgyrCDS12361 [Dimorphilus gyrociliatus]
MEVILAEDSKPITVFNSAIEILNQDITKIRESSDLIQDYDNIFENLQEHTNNTTDLLNSSKGYLEIFQDKQAEIRQSLSRISENISSKINSQYVPYAKERNKVKNDEDRMHKRQKLNKITHAYQVLNKQIKELAQFCSLMEKDNLKITEDAEILNENMRKIREEIEQKRMVAEKLKKEEEDRKKAEELERIRVEEEERKRKEEEERKREEEENLRLEQEKLRKIEEEKKRKALEERLKKEGEEREKRKREQKRRQEEEKKKQELEEKRRDRRNWPSHTYTISKEEDMTATGLGCHLKALEDDLSFDNVTCRLEEDLNMISQHPFDDNADIVSNILNFQIKCTKTIRFQYPVIVSIPHQSCRKVNTKEIIVRLFTSDGWIDVNPLNSINDSKIMESLKSTEGKIPLIHCQLKYLEPVVKVCVVHRPRVEKERVKPDKGTTVTSTIDSRVSIRIPKNSFGKKTEEIELQILQTNKDARVRLRKFFNMPESFLETSVVLNLNMPNIVKNGVFIGMPFPGTASVKARKTSKVKTPGASCQVREKTQLNLGEKIVIVTETEDGYHVKDGLTYEIVDDTVEFLVKEKVKRIFLITTTSDSTRDDNINIAQNIKILVTQKKAAIFQVSQIVDNPNKIAIVCSSSDNVKSEQADLEGAGYSLISGDSEICVNEGERLLLNFTKNVQFEEKIPAFYFFQCRSFKVYASVKVVEPYAQNGRESYFGKLQVLSYCNPNEAETGKTKVHCEIQVDLPKKMERCPTPKRTSSVPIREKGLLNQDYFERIAHQLVTNWKNIAESLKLSTATIDRITKEKDTDEERAYSALKAWYSLCAINDDCVRLLANSLKFLSFGSSLSLLFVHLN